MTDAAGNSGRCETGRAGHDPKSDSIAPADTELVEKAIEGEIVLADGIVVETHARDPQSFGAGYAAGYVAGLRKALGALRSGLAG